MQRFVRHMILVLLYISVSASQASAVSKAAIQHQLEHEITEFCRTVHQSTPVIRPDFISVKSRTKRQHPDLQFDFKNIQCKGVKSPALKQCGFCGLTMRGMECLVKTFTFRNGAYRESKSSLEPVAR